jgi:hypothetical protein
MDYFVGKTFRLKVTISLQCVYFMHFLKRMHAEMFHLRASAKGKQLYYHLTGGTLDV